MNAYRQLLRLEFGHFRDTCNRTRLTFPIGMAPASTSETNEVYDCILLCSICISRKPWSVENRIPKRGGRTELAPRSTPSFQFLEKTNGVGREVREEDGHYARFATIRCRMTTRKGNGPIVPFPQIGSYFPFHYSNTTLPHTGPTTSIPISSNSSPPHHLPPLEMRFSKCDFMRIPSITRTLTRVANHDYMTIYTA